MFKKLIIGTAATFGTLALITPAASAWSATYLQGQNWAITCANGTSFSYHGDSGGLDLVGPALCPGGVTGPGGGGLGVIDRLEAGTRDNMALATVAGFPPHGYPCLGCEPCPGDEENFCSTVDGVIGKGDVVWSTQGMDRETAAIMKKRYNLGELKAQRYERGRPTRPAPRIQRR